MFVLLLTGPPGAGKSEVLTGLHDDLGAAGVSNALLELDELQRCYPPLDRGRLLAHLGMLCRSYGEAGHDLLLLAATLEDDAYADAVLEAAGTDEHLVVRLEASPATLERRLRSREPPGWVGLPELVRSSRRLAAGMKALGGVELVLSTEGTEPRQVAAQLEAALRERLPPGFR
jgi:AAA domain-containing protein